MYKKILSSILCLSILIFPSFGTVNAKEKPETSKIDYNVLSKYEEQMKNYLTENQEGLIELNIPKKIHIPKEYKEILLKELYFTNQMIAGGYLMCDDQFNLTATDKYSESVETANPDSQVQAIGNTVSYASAGGVTKIQFFVFGFNLYLSSYYAAKVAAGIQVAAIMSIFFPDPLVSKALAAGLSLYAALIGYNNAGGTGVIIRGVILYIPLPSAFIYWIQPQ